MPSSGTGTSAGPSGWSADLPRDPSRPPGAGDDRPHRDRREDQLRLATSPPHDARPRSHRPPPSPTPLVRRRFPARPVHGSGLRVVVGFGRWPRPDHKHGRRGKDVGISGQPPQAATTADPAQALGRHTADIPPPAPVKLRGEGDTTDVTVERQKLPVARRRGDALVGIENQAVE